MHKDVYINVRMHIHVRTIIHSYIHTYVNFAYKQKHMYLLLHIENTKLQN